MKKFIILVLPFVILSTHAFGQGCPSDPRANSCGPGSILLYDGNREICRACTGNTVSNGCVTSCGACPAGAVSNAAHSACIPMCPASVTGVQLQADAGAPSSTSGGSSPLSYRSFQGNIRQPSVDPHWWWPPEPPGQASLYTFANRQTCDANWTWSLSTPGVPMGSPGQAVQCKYKLTKLVHVGGCPTSIQSHFTIVCNGSACLF